MASKLALMITAAFALVALEGRAHHSFVAEFDPDQPVHLVGTVTAVEFINPHSWIHIDVKSADGSVESWAIEGGTPNTLFRKGITDSTLPSGAEIVVDGYRARDGSNTASGRDITLPDGSKVFLTEP